jgi:hypothetical protein
MLSDVTGVDKPGSVVEHVVEDAFFDEFFEFGVSLLSDFVGVLDAGAELEVVLEETVGGSLFGFDLAFHGPGFMADYFLLETLDLIVELGFG